MNISLDSNDLGVIQLFTKLTHTDVKDSFDYKDRRVFVVPKGSVKKALGKNNKNVEVLMKKLGKKVKIVEFDENPEVFIANFLKPLKIRSITQNDGKINIVGEDRTTQGLIIGAKAQNLRTLEKIVQKYFPIKEITVGQNGEEI